MMNRKYLFTGIAIATIAIGILGWVLFHPAKRTLTFAVGNQNQEFSYAEYAEVLKLYVDDLGMVNYRALKQNQSKLDSFAALIGKVKPETIEGWSERDRLAFWVNAYNALTLEAIVNNYPITPSVTGKLLFPENSIRQIPGVWDTLFFTVAGTQTTLGHIEHQILRKQFHEPRIHMALVCAAHGCPILRNEPYLGEKLSEQLEDQSRRFVTNPQKYRLDVNTKTLYLSSIFKWFGEDFTHNYRAVKTFAGHSERDRAVLNFISQYLSPTERASLAQETYRIEYLTYDWSLNEQIETSLLVK